MTTRTLHTLALVALALVACDDPAARQKLAQYERDNAALRAENERLKAAATTPTVPDKPKCELEDAKKADPEGLAKHAADMAAAKRKFDDATAALKAIPVAAAKLLAPPAGAPSAPHIAITITERVPVDAVAAQFNDWHKPPCYLTWETTEQKFDQITGDYRELTKVATDSWQNFAKDHATDAGANRKMDRDRNLAEYLRWHLFTDEGVDANLAAAKAVIDIVNNDNAITLQLTSWAATLSTSLLSPKSALLTDAALTDLYKASTTDFSSFYTDVVGEDIPPVKTPDGGHTPDGGTEGDDAFNEKYYNFGEKSEHLKGILLRRWIEKGGNKGGDAFILRFRYHIVELAAARKLPDAKIWANETRAAFLKPIGKAAAERRSGLNTAPYLARLATIAK